MSRNLAVVRCVAGAWLATLALAAPAAPIALGYDTFFEAKTLFRPLATTSPIRLDGRLYNTDLTGGALNNTLTFVAGSTAVSLSAGWLVQPLSNRTVGFNVDIVEVGTNIVVASDTFTGVTGGTLANSTLTAAGLTPGLNYRVEVTATAQGQVGRFEIALVDGAVPPPPPAPAVAAVPSTNAFTFDTLVGTKSLFSDFGTGDTTLLDGMLSTDGPGAVTNEFEIFISSGTFSVGTVWVVNLPGAASRLVGLNVDLLDAFDTVVASDDFQGVFGGQAYSQLLATGLAPGAYRLLLTGTQQGSASARYRMDLTSDRTAAPFVPIVDVPPLAVPEPGFAVLLIAGAFGMAAVRRRRNARRG